MHILCFDIIVSVYNVYSMTFLLGLCCFWVFLMFAWRLVMFWEFSHFILVVKCVDLILFITLSVFIRWDPACLYVMALETSVFLESVSSDSKYCRYLLRILFCHRYCIPIFCFGHFCNILSLFFKLIKNLLFTMALDL